MLHLKRLSIAAALLVGACSTTEQAQLAINDGWLGRPADDFFLAHGLPDRQFTRNDGRILYEWSNSRSVGIPTTQTTTGYGPGGPFTATTTGGYTTARMDCTLQILVNQAGAIDSIRVLNDTIGRWETSRCHELFGSLDGTR